MSKLGFLITAEQIEDNNLDISKLIRIGFVKNKKLNGYTKVFRSNEDAIFNLFLLGAVRNGNE